MNFDFDYVAFLKIIYKYSATTLTVFSFQFPYGGPMGIRYQLDSHTLSGLTFIMPTALTMSESDRNQQPLTPGVD